MSPNQFWYDDIYLLDAYIEAYNEKTMSEAKMLGLYNHIAFSCAIRGAFGEKEGTNYFKECEEFESNLKGKETEEELRNKEKERQIYWSTIKQRIKENAQQRK